MRQIALILALAATMLVAPMAAAPAPAPWPDPAAAHDALLVRVGTGGVQRLSGAALAAAGLGLDGLDPARLWLRRAGAPVPLELRAGDDGRLDPGDEVRFYAPPPGDRWNAADTYWLTVEQAPALPMAHRDVSPGPAPARTQAREIGVAYAPARYDSRRPGPDADNWFAADLRAEPGAPVTHTLTLSATLPPGDGATTITVTGELYTGGSLQLRARLGAATASGGWTGAGPQTSFFALVGGATTLTLEAAALGGQAAALLDRVMWERPARLALGGRGAAFAGVAGRWRYTLAAPPEGWALYDVTDPAAPWRLDTGGALSFEDGPEPRAYIVAGPGTLHEPAIARWHASDIAAPRTADVVYIAPEALHQALAPLVALREAQGYTVSVVGVEVIYAAWSHGAVDPEALRSFLRYAAATWERPPRYAVLVGDGSSDPHDWTAHGPLNVNLIPPYLAPVDPWLGEAACDTCYGRFAGDSPIGQPVPDIIVGRLPVKSAAELATLVAKLAAHEAAPPEGVWRGTLGLLAEEQDTAGDFVAAAELAVGLLPAGARVRRAYYDPSGARGPSDAVAAHTLARQVFDEGAAVLIYHGHSHQWQWALTDPAAAQTSMLGLYDPDSLANAGRLPAVLAMTCLSSAFQTPARSGTTIDERLVLARGGAAVVWGPAGFGVAHGHAQLQAGFLAALRDAPGGWATAGELAMAGYRALAASDAAHDPLYTYVLLGDPLTTVRLSGLQRVSLPSITR